MPWWALLSKKPGTTPPASWQPSDEPDYGAFHLDVSLASTVTKDGSDLISQLDGVAGAYGPFTQTGTARPLWVDAILNGLPGMLCDGVNDFLLGPSTKISGLTNGTPFWGFFVVNMQSAGNGNFNVICSLSINSPDEGTIAYRKLSMGLSEGVATYSTFFITISGSVDSTIPGSKPSMFNASVDFSDGPHVILFSNNGGDPALPATWRLFKGATEITLSIGGGSQGASKSSKLMAWDDGSLNGKGYFHEGVIFNASEIDTTKLTNALGYCGTKWGTATAAMFSTRFRFPRILPMLLPVFRTGLETLPPRQLRWGKIAAVAASTVAIGAAVAYHFL